MLSFFYSRFLDILHEAPLSGQRKRTRILGSILYCFLLASICSNLQNCCVCNWVSCDLQFSLNILSFHVPYWSFWEVEEWSSMACGEGHVILFEMGISSMAYGEGHVILFEMGIGESLFVHWYGLFSIPAFDWKFFFFPNRAGFGPFDVGIRHLPGSFLWILFILFEELVKFFSSFGEFG